MCEETAVSYKTGDVVWAKLGPCWWPGEVVSFEELPSDISDSFKKPPLAVVKFFDEEKYEFIKQLTHIHSYNTNRKYDFIKKGMDLYRAKHSFMDKFPADVCSAERKTDGNPNILDDERVAPDKKKNYSSIFGSPLRKKSARDTPRSRGRSSTGKLQSATTGTKVYSLITHPRFLGNDDSEIKILVQTPSAATSPESEYRCYSCDFKANRIDVIILHNKSHLRRPSQPGSPKKLKTTSKKSKKQQLPTSKTETIEEDLALLKQGLPHCSDNEDVSSASSDSDSEESDDEPLAKKKPKPKSPPKPKKQKSPPVPEVKKQTDIRTDLLAEWDDDDDDEEEEPATKKVETSITESEDTKNEKEPPKSEDKNKSCFDFVEDEEDLITTMEGRRLPRVIPPTDKRKSIHELEKEMSRKSRSPSPHSHESMEVDGESSKPNAEKEIENSDNDSNKKRYSQFQLEFEAFNHALKELTVPDIPPAEKYEQNFPNAKTIKFPDKPDMEVEVSETPPDIESSPEDISKDEKKEEDQKKEGIEKKERSDKKIEEKPIDIKVETSTTNVKEPVVKKTEVATKLTNPKKRFVKTFEDETKNSTAKESVVQEEKKEASPEPVKSDSEALEVASLKTKLMKKLVDSPPKKEPGRKPEKPRKNLPRNKKLRAPIDIVKEVVEDKNKKRARTDSNNDYETKSYAKRKRFSLRTKEIKEVIDESKKEIPMDVKELAKRDIEDKVEESIDSNRVTLENRRSSTPSLLSDINVEEDELLSSNILSESQKLTIQNIIGVSSPILAVPSASVENSRTDDNAKSNEDKLKVKKELSNVDSTISNNDKEEIKDLTPTDEDRKDPKESANELVVEEILNKEDVTDKPLNVDMEIEENIDNTANTQILELTDKLSTEISENLPEEIIEEPVEKVESKVEEIVTEMEEIFPESKEGAHEIIETEITIPEEILPESTEGVDELIGKEIRRPKDPIKKVSEEKFEKFLEENFTKSYEKKPDPPRKLVIELEKMSEEQIRSKVKAIGKSEDEQNTAVDIEAEIKPQEPLEDKKIEEAVTEDKKIEEAVTEDKNIEQEKEMNIVVDDILAIKTDDEMEIEVSSESLENNKTDLVKSMFSEDEMVNIEGNLTVVTESDLADKQVEITATQEVSKPITLSSFSMDFCEDVGSYIKGEDLMHSFPKSNSTSPIPVKEKIPLKDDTQKDIEDIKLDSNSGVEEIVENLPKIEDVIIDESNKIIESIEIKPDENKPQQKETDIQSNVQAETDHANGKTKVSLKLEDIMKPITKDESAKDIQPTLKSQELHIGFNLENLLKEYPKEKKIANIPTKKEIMQKEEIIVPAMDISVESEVAKLTDSLIEQEVVIQDVHPNTTSTKLLEILTDRPKSSSAKSSPVFITNTQSEEKIIISGKQPYKQAKFVTRASTSGPSKLHKTTILDNQLIKPFDDSKTVSVKKVTKRTYQDVEDIDTFIIQKPAKKLNVSIEPESPTPKMIKKPVVSKGKARILQQTIITPTGDILQPPVSQSQSDDNMFDINSMPIVLSDEILTPESIENMQIVLQDNTKSQINPIKKQVVTTTTTQQIKLLNKSQSPATLTGTILKNPTPSKTYISKQQTIQKVYPSSSPKLKSNTSVITQPGKQGRFVIMPTKSTPTGTKYTVGKRPAIVKKPPQKVVTPISKIQEIPMTSSGNKIMILKSQGQQQKILLTTPSQQKQTPIKMKGRPLGHKQILTKESPHTKANIISQTIVNSKGQITTVPSQTMTSTNRGQVIAAIAQQNRSIKLDPTKLKRPQQQRVYIQNEITKPSTSGQRTIIIKNPQGQTVKKIQGSSDDALLDQQVAEQLQAINRASATQHIREYSPKTAARIPVKKCYSKKQEVIKQIVTSKTASPTTQTPTKTVTVPPLAPISPVKKAEAQLTESTESKVSDKTEEAKRPPHQLVIQDAQGNQTTITEGQILALPSEAIDGQPHSYVLVTLDETGNLTPLNSEALMSLDPNLNLTSDLGNMVLQIDQGASAETETKVQSPAPVVQRQVETTSKQSIKEVVEKPPQPPPPPPVAENVLLNETPAVEGDQNVQAVINSGEMGQLIITGDAATAQKFLESLAEGNADLANLLANAEGNVLIQADGQQILINTDSENSMLVMNPEGMPTENSEGSGNPIFASQPAKNQDILAAALADTDVFQQDQSITHSPSKVAQSQLSPNSALYPMNVGNVLETNSMNSPIMTPLEIPSTNIKKIDDEREILTTQVPKNIDLPITITDPNISQTVASLAAEIPTNLDLPLTIQEPGTSRGMNSPSFVYSLPTLDDTVDINQKAFTGSISMPLLTEEPEESIAGCSSSSETLSKNIEIEKKDKSDSSKRSISPRSPKSGDKKRESDDKKTDYMDTEGLRVIRGGICNSLSEPPPDMFDFTVENQTYESSDITETPDIDIPMDTTPASEITNTVNDQESVFSVEERKTDDAALYTINTTSPSTNTDDSCEIPIQPLIVAKPFEENGTSDSKFGEEKIATDGDV